MSASTELDWGRFDVTAIVTYSGLATIDNHRHQACRDWLLRQGYEVDTFDCGPGLAIAVPELGRLLCWEQQFGYTLGPESRNLDALRDGFDFAIPEGGGRVLEILRPDLAWKDDQRWLRGLLDIAQEHCRYQLALGCRFFVLLVVPDHSPLIGEPLEEARVPGVYWKPRHPTEVFSPE